MEAVIRQVRDLDSAERSAIERHLGHALGEDQELVIQVIDATSSAARLPDWCHVYKGLSDEQVADLEQTVLRRADLSGTNLRTP